MTFVSSDEGKKEENKGKANVLSSFAISNESVMEIKVIMKHIAMKIYSAIKEIEKNPERAGFLIPLVMIDVLDFNTQAKEIYLSSLPEGLKDNPNLKEFFDEDGKVK